MTDNLPPLPPCAPEFKPRWPNDPGGYTTDQMKAYARAALAAAPQPQPVQQAISEIPKSWFPGLAEKTRQEAWRIYQTSPQAAQPQPVQEPIADIKISGDDFDLGLTDAFAFGRLRLPDGHYQLYTSQQAAQPLTHLQAKALAEKYGNDPLNLIFQTEKAHGIKGTT